MKKKMNNKGFSLVELIIVIAIMAVLIGILAPQFLRYVERSRLQKDNTAISEIANAAKIAESDETINAIGSKSIVPATGVYTFNASGDAFDKEMNAAVGTTVSLTSNTYKTHGAPTITVTVSGNGVTVSAPIYETPDSAAAVTKVY